MKIMLPLLACTALLTLGACSSQNAEPEAQGTDASVMESASAGADREEAVEASPAASASAAPAIPSDAIPPAMRGRWGLVAADCTSTKGDAKGLMVVSPDTLKFYESVAKLGMIQRVDADLLAASFKFSGEGHSWILEVALELSDDGETLTRRDKGPDAMPEPLVYSRCTT
ncbi:hypothetical protein [Novosphingobium aquimarinum]|uniref:hypothetical protein n=1 Tax=Novosphingobium aquimarinum TaxID=2682494 RepID=UPI0012EB4F9E|nr:hypothetical protein [Novosphingobium aquimarinum]